MKNTDQPAMRLGLRMITGLPRAVAERLMEARQKGPFKTVRDLARRAGLAQGDMEKLAAAGALAGIAGNRHQARWEALGIESIPPLFENMGFTETPVKLPEPTVGEDLVADYATLKLSLGPHPLALLRARLQRMRTAARVLASRHGEFVRVTGLVISRQCPSSASGVIFMTLEDETGFINVVVWPWVTERQRKALLGSRLLEIAGVVEREGAVVHVVAGRLTDRSRLLGRLDTRSRDFR